jgi:cytochrome c peroxidase
MKWTGRAGALAIGAVIIAGGGGCSSPASAPECDLPNVPGQYCAEAHEMLLPNSLPPAPGNKYADNNDAAMLGFSLFFDSNMGTGVSCATCHEPELAFTDQRSVSLGKSLGIRNAPTIFNSAMFSVFFWDGRADSLWSQPLFPIENPLEMGSTRLALVQFIEGSYKAKYEKVFGPLPDTSSWPTAGMPGDAAFDGLSSDVQEEVNRIFANVGKALEAFMRKDVTSRAPFDAFLQGDSTQLIEAAQRGFGTFLSSNCQSCHSGPMLTDQQFHNVDFPSLPGAKPDPGRAGGLPILQANIFNLAGPYADPGPGVPGVIPQGTGQFGAFRTPSLRNIDLTFPYGHDGASPGLTDMLGAHAAAVKAPSLSADEQGDIIVFLFSLNGAYPPAPWDNWPIPQ